MKILIDTACWLWSLTDPARLNKEAIDLVADPSQVLFLSAASSWEISIKAALGKLQLPEPPGKYVPGRMAAFNIVGLPIEHTHALRVFSLPPHHRDPFDRILIAQALVENMPILTADRIFLQYKAKVIWAGIR